MLNDYLADRINSTCKRYYAVFTLLGLCLSLNAQAAVDNQALYQAIQQNDVTYLKRQLAGGLNPNRRLKGSSLLVHAIETDRVDMVKVLLAGKADYQNYIFRQTLQGNSRAVSVLIEAGAELTSLRDKQGETLLMIAAREGHEDIVKSLVQQGADVNAKSHKGHSAMTFSSRYGHLAIVQYLLNHGAEVNITNNNKWTPLLKAARGGHLEVVDYLLAHDADIRSRNSAGLDALALAKRYGHKQVVHYLKNYK